MLMDLRPMMRDLQGAGFDCREADPAPDKGDSIWVGSDFWGVQVYQNGEVWFAHFELTPSLLNALIASTRSESLSIISKHIRDVRP